MRAVLIEPFAANLIASPPEVQKAFGKQPRINDDWRMYFTVEGDTYVLRAITPHPK